MFNRNKLVIYIFFFLFSVITIRVELREKSRFKARKNLRSGVEERR